MYRNFLCDLHSILENTKPNTADYDSAVTDSADTVFTSDDYEDYLAYMEYLFTHEGESKNNRVTFTDFFTVYGPMGRSDMAYFGFTEKLRRGDTIKVFKMGDCRRDFTYVDDIVESVRRVMVAAPEVRMGEDGLPLAARRVYNIGNSHPENLLDFVDALQRVLVEEGVLPVDYDFDAHKQLVRPHAARLRTRHLRGYHGAPARPGLQARDPAGGRWRTA